MAKKRIRYVLKKKYLEEQAYRDFAPVFVDYNWFEEVFFPYQRGWWLDR